MSESEKEQCITHYKSRHRILLVGDGDFSFSLCLAKSMETGRNIVASSLDSYDELTKKYAHVKSNIEELNYLGAEVIHGVDAKSMLRDSRLNKKSFDRIIFNFPNCGLSPTASSVLKIRRHRGLLRGFFSNAVGLLHCDGEIHVTVKTVPPDSNWKLEELADTYGLVLKESCPFFAKDYPGYINKTARLDRSFQMGQCATYKFIRLQELLIDKLGCQKIDQKLIDRIQCLTGCMPHVFLRRGVFPAHRDMDVILDAFENGKKFYLYIGIQLSNEALSLGDLVTCIFSKYLQDAFKAPAIIQLIDVDCMLSTLSRDDRRIGLRDIVKNIIACGFDVNQTFVFSDTDIEDSALYKNTSRMTECLTFNTVQKLFGFSGEDNLRKIFLPMIQGAASSASSFPYLLNGENDLLCLIPSSIEQDAVVRMTRDIAPILGWQKPATIESSVIPSLRVIKEKLTDVKSKIDFKVLYFFLESDDDVKDIKERYSKAEKLNDEGKLKLMEILNEMENANELARNEVRDEVVDLLMSIRHLH